MGDEKSNVISSLPDVWKIKLGCHVGETTGVDDAVNACEGVGC
jgi:hypothetical protein